MSRRGYAQSAFSRNIDEILRSAETALVQRSPYPASLRDAYVDPTVDAGPPQITIRQADPGPSQVDELSRQLRTCMRELQELRSELHAERESRTNASSSHVKRIRDEISVEVRQGEHTLRQELRTLEASLVQRVTALENGKAVERSRADEAVRMAKVNQSSMFDLGEQLKEGLDEMRSRGDRIVAQNANVKEECAAIVEREKQRLTARLDAELSRIAESHRTLLAQVADAKGAVAKEVLTVSGTIGDIVEQAWKTQLRGTDRHVEHKLSEFQTAMEKMHSQLSEDSDRSTRRTRELQDETKQLQSTLVGRISSLESAVPLLDTRVDRCERRADAALEGSNRAAAEMDILRESCDKAITQGQRSMECSKKVESSVGDRDTRLASLETQLASLSGMEKWRQEVEGTRRSQLRLEAQLDALHQSAEKDARAVAAMQRSVDDSADKIVDAGRKVSKAVAVAESVGQRLTVLSERVSATEDAVEAAHNKAVEACDAADRTGQKSATHEARIANVADKMDSSLRDAFSRLSALDIKLEGVLDAMSQAAGVGPSVKKEVERLERRIAKSEAALANAVDNIQDTRDAVDAAVADVTALQRRVEATRDVPSTRDLSGLEGRADNAAEKAQSAMAKVDRLEERLFGRLESVSQELGSRIHTLVARLNDSRAADTFEVSAISTSQLETDVGAARKRLDVFENRIRSLEELVNDVSASYVKRADVQVLARSSMTHLEREVQAVKAEVASMLNADRTVNRSSPTMNSLPPSAVPTSSPNQPSTTNPTPPLAADTVEHSPLASHDTPPTQKSQSAEGTPSPAWKEEAATPPSKAPAYATSRLDESPSYGVPSRLGSGNREMVVETMSESPMSDGSDRVYTEEPREKPNEEPKGCDPPQQPTPSWLDSPEPVQRKITVVDDFDDDDDDGDVKEEEVVDALQQNTLQHVTPTHIEEDSGSESSESDAIPELPVEAAPPTAPIDIARNQAASRVATVPSGFNESSSSSDTGLPDNSFSRAAAPPQSRPLPVSTILSKAINDFDDDDDDEESSEGSGAAKAALTPASAPPPLAGGVLSGRVGRSSPPASVARSKVSAYSKQTADVSLSLSTTSPRTRRTDFDDDDDDDEDVDDDALAAMLGSMK